MPEVLFLKNPVLKNLVAFVAINGFASDAGNFVPVMPDGICALVINTGQAYERIQPGDDKECNVKGSHFVGIKSKFCFVKPNEGMRTVTIRFKPGALPFFLKHKASDLTDKVVDADQLFGRDIRFLEEKLADENDSAMVLYHIEEFLLSRLNFDSRFDDILMKIKTIYANPIQCKVTDLKGDYVSYKYLERAFLRHLGIPPKSLIEIVQFNYAGKLLFQHPSSRLVSIGHESGYYDQSHFIRAFKKLSGFTPGQYVAQKSIMFLDNQQRIIDQLK